MAHIVLARELAFQRVKEDDPKIPDGPEEIVTKGHLVPDYVPLYVISALEAAGMIVPVADEGEVAVEQIGPIEPIPTAPIPAPETPASFFPPADDEATTPVATGPATPAQPKASDNRTTWENYAVDVAGMSRDEAEAFNNKSDLIEAVQARLGK